MVVQEAAKNCQFGAATVLELLGLLLRGQLDKFAAAEEMLARCVSAATINSGVFLGVRKYPTGTMSIVKQTLTVAITQIFANNFQIYEDVKHVKHVKRRNVG